MRAEFGARPSMVHILGAGLSGCLAGIVNPEATILEAKTEGEFLKSPEHKAVLRFRTDKISQLTGIPFQQVQVRKSIWYDGKEYRLPDIRFTNMYSRKVAGGYFDRSIVNLDTVTRWIAPEDFHLRLLKKVNGRVKFGYKLVGLNKDWLEILLEGRDPEDTSPWKRNGPVISTIPMPVMAKVLKIDSPVSFQSGRRVYVFRYRIRNANLNLSMYYPSPDTPVYRASVMKDILSIETIEDELKKSPASHSDGRCIEEVLQSLGIGPHDVESLDQGSQLGKISYNLDDRVRKNWVFRLTIDFWIYSLGRFAIWKNILQDDVYDDAHKIRGYIESGTHYDFYREAATS